jgi:Lrp/AsnC family transcriptional regulator, leucine-responsive regulatory protein
MPVIQEIFGIMLDVLDRKILDQLQDDSGLSAEEIARRVGASRSSVQRRIQQLRDANLIEREAVQVSPALAGGFMTFIVEVELERERIDLLDDFRRSMRALPQVQQCYYVTGHTDFVVIVLAEDMKEYEKFSRQVFTENPNIRRFHTNVVVDRVKVSLKVPLVR